MKPTHIILAAGVVCSIATQGFCQGFLVTKGSGQVGKKQGAYSAAVIKQSYPLGWWAKTGGDRMEMEFSPGNEFILLPGSEAEISDRTDNRAPGLQRKVSLKTGKVRMELNGSGAKSIQVETPTAICGAVGTVFEVNAVMSDFNITKGAIYLSTKGDETFKASSISGNVSVDPGQENTAVSGTITGKFQVNGEPLSGAGAKIEVAKADGGTSDAALLVTGGNVKSLARWQVSEDRAIDKVAPVTTIAPGSYIMEPSKQKLIKVTDPETKKVHSQYIAAAKKEGQLNVQKQAMVAARQPVPRSLSASISVAAKDATKLRSMLFSRKVVRNVARAVIRNVTRPGGI